MQKTEPLGGADSREQCVDVGVGVHVDDNIIFWKDDEYDELLFPLKQAHEKP